MRSLFFEDFSNVCGRAMREGEMKIGSIVVLMSADDKEGRNGVERDIMQLWCMMDIFTLLIHMYNITNWIVGIKLVICGKRRVQISKYGIVCVGEHVEEADGRFQGNEVYGCVIGWCYLAAHHCSTVKRLRTNFSGAK